MDKFTPEEISVAQGARQFALQEDTPTDLKGLYMAGEINMHEELKPLINALERLVKLKVTKEVKGSSDMLKTQREVAWDVAKQALEEYKSNP